MIKRSIFQSPLFYLSIIISMFAASCGDDDSDVNTTQVTDSTVVYESKIQTQIDVLNKTGEFLEFNLMVVEDGQPVEGALVEMSAASNGEEKNVSSTTNAEGMVYFDALTIGGNILTVSKEGYSTMLGVINFRFENGYNYEIIDGNVLPIAKNESAIVPLFSASSESAATISGKVTVESDLTNDVLEFPEGIQISANLNDYVVSQSDGVDISEFTMNNNGNYGTAIVAADGTYELKVPATADGTNVTMLIPEITMDQTLYAYGTEAEPSEVPVKLSIATSYGPNVYNYTTTPFVSGVNVEFNEPEAVGSGFGITNVRKMGRSFDFNYYLNLGVNNYSNGVRYSFTGGSNYTSTPEVVITDDTGTGAEAYAGLEFGVSGLTLDNTLTGYPSNQYVTINFYYDYNYQGDDYTYSSNFASMSIDADANGEIDQESITNRINEYVASGSYGFAEYPRTTTNKITRIYAQVYNSSTSSTETLDGVILESNVYRVYTSAFGSGYTNPSISFQGGGATTPAEIEILEFATPWTFDLDNSQITNPYVALSFDISIEYYTMSSSTEYAQTTTFMYDESSGYSSQIKDFLKVTADGQIALYSDDAVLRTSFYSNREPNFYINHYTMQKAVADASVNTNGEVLAIYVMNSGYGYIDKPIITISPSVEGIGGSGAVVEARGGSYQGQFYNWYGDYYISSKGSGYLYDLNLSRAKFGSTYRFDISGSSSIKVVSGQSYIRHINYGSGSRNEKVN